MKANLLVGSIALALSSGAFAVIPGKFATSNLAGFDNIHLKQSSSLTSMACSLPEQMTGADLDALIAADKKVMIQLNSSNGCSLIGFYDTNGQLIPYETFDLVSSSSWGGLGAKIVIDTQTKQSDRRALFSAAQNGDLTLIDKTHVSPGQLNIYAKYQENSDVYAISNWPQKNAVSIVDGGQITAQIKNTSIYHSSEFVALDTFMAMKPTETNPDRTILLDKTGQRVAVNVGNDINFFGVSSYLNLYDVTNGELTGVFSGKRITDPEAEWQQVEITKLVPELANPAQVSLGTLDYYRGMKPSFEYYNSINASFSQECHVITANDAYNLFGTDFTTINFMENGPVCTPISGGAANWKNVIVYGTFYDAPIDPNTGKFLTPLTPFIAIQTPDAAHKLSLAGTELEKYYDQVINHLQREINYMDLDQMATSGVAVEMAVEDFESTPRRSLTAKFDMKINGSNQFEFSNIKFTDL